MPHHYYFHKKRTQKNHHYSGRYNYILAYIYIYLLPLGGYRPYRENIIRSDTIIPITILLFYICGLSTYLLVKHIITKKVFIFLYLIIIGDFIYTYSKKDTNIIFDNKCEKEALVIISKSKDSIVALQNNCQIVSWGVITDYNESKQNGKLLKILGVTKDVKMYYTIQSSANKIQKKL